MAKHRGSVAEINRPEGLEAYTIRVQPNWVARISTAAVMLLVLFFSVTQYQASNDAKALLNRESKARIAADSDRRIATAALSAARASQEQAAQDRAKVLVQNGQLIEIALALEDQIARLGVDPVVPPNDVLKLKARTAVGKPSSATPGAFAVPRASSKPKPTKPTGSTPTSTPTPTPLFTANLPIASPVCVPPVVCIG